MIDLVAFAAWFSELPPVTVQAFGFVGFGLFGLSFQLLKPRHTIFLQSLANIFIAAHFFGMGQVFIALIALMASGRDFCSASLPRQVQIMFLAFYLFPLFIVTYSWAEIWPDFLAAFSSAIGAGLQFFRERFYAYRFLSALHQGLWLSIYISVFTVPGIVFMSCILMSNVIGIGRYVYKVTAEERV